MNTKIQNEKAEALKAIQNHVGQPNPSPLPHMLTFQLDILKMEIDIIQKIIARQDGITQATKNWSIVVWTASIGLAIGRDDLRPFLCLTAILPTLFWFIDAVWRRLQSRSAYRMFKISDFINSEVFFQSFQQGSLKSFLLLDPVGRQYKGTSDYRQYVSLRRTLRFKEVSIFYAIPIVISICLGLYFILFK